jgi:hypothetical protein
LNILLDHEPASRGGKTFGREIASDVIGEESMRKEIRGVPGIRRRILINSIPFGRHVVGVALPKGGSRGNAPMVRNARKSHRRDDGCCQECALRTRHDSSKPVTSFCPQRRPVRSTHRTTLVGLGVPRPTVRASGVGLGRIFGLVVT